MEKVDRDVPRVGNGSGNGGGNSGNVAVISDNDFVIYRWSSAFSLLKIFFETTI